MKNIAIVGAGITGLTVAHFLKNHANITFFEKSRGVSGRISTRRSGELRFDHGAQYFCVKTPEFATFIKPLVQAGIILPWHARFVEIKNKKIIKKTQWNSAYPHYVGVPGMNAVGKFLAQDCNIYLSTLIQKMVHNNCWELIDGNNQYYGGFDWVILSVPAEQAQPILPSNLSFYHQLQKVIMSGCYTLMISFNQPISLDFDAALVHDNEISWISVNSTKPGRDNTMTMIVNSTNQWADQFSHLSKTSVAEILLTKLSKMINITQSDIKEVNIHFWKYANSKKKKTPLVLVDNNAKLAVCGDWCVHSRVESAFISGLTTANALKQYL